MSTTIRIALNRPIRRLFDYKGPADPAAPLQPGQRVRVPFGRQSAVGIVTETGVTPPEGITLKPVQCALEDWPLIPQETLQLLTWAANYYQHPLGECLFTALPPALRKGHAAVLKEEASWQPARDAHPSQLPGNAQKQKALLKWLLTRDQPASAPDIRQAGFTTAQANALATKGFLEQATLQAFRTHPLPELSTAQKAAYAQLPAANNRFSAALLYGVTGSGKTEIYLHYLQEQLSQEQQALVLVPEINLTPQTVARFHRYFGDRVATWHSALNDRERLRTWLRIRRGEPVILIGTRSAAMLPFTRLGALIVDEEHDSSYKQGEGFRYSARDLAVYRAHLNKCPVILGSATPSLESVNNTLTGKYTLTKLEERAGGALPPTMKLLDIRSRPLEGGLAAPSLTAIRESLAKGQQVLVYVNRRGYSPVMMCFDCGHLLECPHCDSRLTYHRRDRAMRCHHCDYQSAAPEFCPSCHTGAMKPIGQGTERAEDVLAGTFPETPIIRIDRDSTQRKGSIQALLKQVNQGDPCILVGTQMLAKGHDFHKVTLVIVVNADGGLFSTDFRAPEQMTQTLLQVSGRAGRGKEPGLVLIQTCHSDHPLLTALIGGDYLSIARQLLEERRPGGLPPFRSMAILRAEGDTMEDSIQFLDNVRTRFSHLPDAPSVELWGPLPATIARRADRHRAQLILLCSSRSPLAKLLQSLCNELDGTPPAKGVRWQIDVDPIESG